jgi:putative hydrolase of HD superfamily
MKEIERFKGQYFWSEYPKPNRYDSNADHSWRLAMLVLLFADKLSKPFNTERALKIALLHDIGEIYAGDADPLGSDGTGLNTHAFNETLKKEKSEKEIESMHKILEQLPEDSRQQFFELWSEYEHQTSFEAQVIKALDKIEATLQIIEWRDGKVFPEHLQFTIKYIEKYADVDPAIREFIDYLIEELKKRYKGFGI